MAEEITKKVNIDINSKSIQNTIDQLIKLGESYNKISSIITDNSGNITKWSTDFETALNKVKNGFGVENIEDKIKSYMKFGSTLDENSKKLLKYNEHLTELRNIEFELRKDDIAESHKKYLENKNKDDEYYKDKLKEISKNQEKSFISYFTDSKNLTPIKSIDDVGRFINQSYSRRIAVESSKITLEKELIAKNQPRLDKLNAMKNADIILGDEEEIERTELKNKIEISNQNIKNSGDAINAAKSAQTNAQVATIFIKLLIDVTKKCIATFENITDISLSFKKNLQDVFKEAKNLLSDALTANSATSLISDSTARNRQLRYGLSASQSFAMGESMNLLNMSSEEDLLYMNSNQATIFKSFMDKYASWYEKMESSGTLRQIQEMQLDLKIFKQEVAMELLQWFSRNKESIMKAVQGLLKITEWLMDKLIKVGSGYTNILSWLSPTSWFSNASTGYDTANSILSSDSVSNSAISSTKITNVTLTMNNNAELANSESDLKSFFNDQGDSLIKQLATQLGES